MQIRLMRPSEQETIEQIYHAVHPKPEPRRDWGGLMVLVAHHEGVAAGYASAMWLTDEIWQQVEILVLPEYQGRGFGRRLMEARLALGGLQGARIAVGGCDDDHTQMRHMFAKHGFVPMPDGEALLKRPDAHLYVKIYDNA